MSDLTDPTSRIARNIKTVARIEHETLKQRSRLDYVTGGIAAFTGSIWFVVANAVLFTVWIWINRPGHEVFDAYPFTLLTLSVSLEAIFLTAFVLMSQNQASKIADRRAQLDLQVNLLTEAEMTKVLQAVRAIARHLDMEGVLEDDETRELAESTNVEEIARAVDHHSSPPAASGSKDADATTSEPDFAPEGKEGATGATADMEDDAEAEGPPDQPTTATLPASERLSEIRRGRRGLVEP